MALRFHPRCGITRKGLGVRVGLGVGFESSGGSRDRGGGGGEVVMELVRREGWGMSRGGVAVKRGEGGGADAEYIAPKTDS